MEKIKLEMEFLNSLNRKYTLSIEDPRSDLIAQDVQDAMEGIISQNVFQVSEGDLAEAVGARIVTTTVNSLEFIV